MTNPFLFAKIYQKRGRILEERGEYEKASSFFKNASENWKKINQINNYKKCLALALECEAKYFKKVENFKEMQVKLIEASKIWEELNIEYNANWCKANVCSSQAMDYFSNQKYAEASKEYEKAKDLFEKVSDLKTKIYCESRQLICNGFVLKNQKRLREASQFFFDAANILREQKIFKESTVMQAYAWLCLGMHEKVMDNFENAMSHLQVSASLFDSMGSLTSKFWSLAQISECKYYLAKESKNIERIIEYLHETIQNFKNANDDFAVKLCTADLCKYEGLKSKSSGDYSNCLDLFKKAKDLHFEFAELDSEISYHKTSILYLDALIVGTEADIDLLINNDPLSAAEKYKKSSELFLEAKDNRSAYYSKKLHLSSLAISKLYNGNIEEAKKLWKIAAPKTIPPITAQQYRFDIKNVQRIISVLGHFITQGIDNTIKEIIELDKGPAFESRIRDFIRVFDNRKIIDKEGKIFGGINTETISLHKYEVVERKIFDVEEDEIGIVFPDKTPIEIDILAERREGNRQHLLVSECKFRPNKKTTLKDIEIFSKKVDFIIHRYEKIAKLQKLFKPIVEEVWYISFGGFKNGVRNEARKKYIKTIDKNGLNLLLKEFGQFTIR